MKYYLIIQYFASGGSSATRRYGGGGGSVTIISTTSLVSERERNTSLVDHTLSTFEDARDMYGTIIDEIQLAELSKKDAGVMAYYDGANIAVNERYFSDAIETAYIESVKSGFHPSNGNKTGIEAVIAHEIGHKITDQVGEKLGMTYADLDTVATRIVKEAVKDTKHRGVVQMANAISTYATHSNAEAIAEAYADVYCNGTKAKAESQAIMKVVDKYLK